MTIERVEKIVLVDFPTLYHIRMNTQMNKQDPADLLDIQPASPQHSGSVTQLTCPRNENTTGDFARLKTPGTERGGCT